MRVYLAGHYSKKLEIKSASLDLKYVGIPVVSTWYFERKPPNVSMGEVSETFRRYTARCDKAELRRATHFVLFSLGPDTYFTRGGHCWENGYADAMGLRVVIVGPRQHVFHYLRGRKRFDTWGQAFTWLKKEARQESR
jgi:hypothetical protein